jgi:hypothetical protein
MLPKCTEVSAASITAADSHVQNSDKCTELFGTINNPAKKREWDERLFHRVNHIITSRFHGHYQVEVIPSHNSA